jgi:hypothetical protein
VLEVAEDATRIQQPINFAVQSTFFLMHEVMNGKAGNHRIKRTEIRQGGVHVVLDNAHPRIPGERLRTASSIAGEKSTAIACVSGCALSTSATKRPSPVPSSRIRTFQVFARVLCTPPEIHRIAVRHTREYRETYKLRRNE